MILKGVDLVRQWRFLSFSMCLRRKGALAPREPRRKTQSRDEAVRLCEVWSGKD